jgi:hypothetical protein
MDSVCEVGGALMFAALLGLGVGLSLDERRNSR